MGERDLAGHERVVARHVREQVVQAVLELDVHSAPALVDVEWCRRPVDSDLLADLPRLVGGESFVRSHRALLSYVKMI
jgi:hypothetical protein